MISVCIIGKNEEKTLERCLKALQPYPFEIVFTDTGSTDNTKAIAAKYTSNIYDFAWVDDFSAARNFCISKATNNWILTIDCDEYLEPFDINVLHSILNANKQSIGEIYQKNMTVTKNGTDSYTTLPVARCFNKKYYHYEHRIHEQLIPNSTSVSIKTFNTGLTVLHSGYLDIEDGMRRKQQRNISLLTKELQSCKPEEKAYYHYQLGMSYKTIDPEQSFANFELVLKHKPDISAPFFKHFIVSYGNDLFEKGRIEEAFHLLKPYYDTLHDHADYIFLYAILLMNQCAYEEALSCFSHCLTCTDCYAEGINSTLTYYNMGLLYRLLGKWQDAIDCFDKTSGYKDSSECIKLLKEKSNHPVPISICMIGKNEEQYLDRCLQCLVPLNCEIIFVDTGSTDNTVQIVSRYTDHIYHFEWINDFSAARNYSLTKASHDWILIVDCDNFLENPEDMYNALPSFLDTVKNHEKEVGVATICNHYLNNNEESISNDKEARFFSKSNCKYTGIIHEQIVSISGEPAPRYMTPFRFFHVGYYGADMEQKKANRNIPLLLKELEQSGPSPYTYYQLGKAYYSIKDYENALTYFDSGLAMDVDPSLSYVSQMVTTFGYTLLELGRHQDALCLEGVYETFDKHADFVFLMGIVYMKNGLFNEAIEQFKKATTLPEGNVVGVNSYMPLYNIGVIYECMGHTKDAIDYYSKCKDYSPAKQRLTALK